MIENYISFIISSLIYSFVTSLRELLEAALIIGIIYGYLTKINRNDLKKDLVYAIGLAILSSLGLAIVFIIFFESLTGYQELIEALIMFIAAGVLSWMILWMWKQSKSIKGDLEKKIDIFVSEGQQRGIFLLVFFAVFRELAELVLFLYASYIEVNINVGVAEAFISILTGFVLGLVVAVVLAYLLFKSTSTLNLKKFFKVTSIILIIFAAGLLANGIHELYEFLEINSPNIANLFVFQEVWNVNNIPILNDVLSLLFGWSYDINYPGRFEKSVIGGIFTGLLGWNDNPALLEVVAYFLYYIFIGILYFSIKNKPEKLTNVEKIPAS